jgi:hypothetical protein
MKKSILEITMLFLLSLSFSSHGTAQVMNAPSDHDDLMHDSIPFTDMPWMHSHEQYIVTWKKLPENSTQVSQQEVERYLYDCLRPKQIETLTKWIGYLKKHGIPENNTQYAGVEIHLLPKTYDPASLPPAIKRVVKK